MQWFPFKVIMFHTSNHMNSPVEHLQSLLKLLSMLKIGILYDEAIVAKKFPDDVGIMYINCGKTIGYLLDNQTIENFITTFFKNMVLQHVDLSWIIQSNQKLNFDFQHHCPS